MKKKGEQSLQMIFGLFLLLIISLVVLAMFFKFVKKGTTETGSAADEYIKGANIEKAIQECENLCTQADDDNSKIEFCSTAYSVDWNKDGSIDGAAQQGKWWFCENKVPCFVLVPDCKNRYDGKYCRQLLAEFAPNKYDQLYNTGEKKPQPPLSSTDFSDGCDLPTSTSCKDASLCPSNPNPDGKYPTQFNWKERMCFSNNYCEVLDKNADCTDKPNPHTPWVCPGDAWNS